MAQKNFALIGAGGHIAPRHMQAVHDTNGQELELSSGVTELHTEVYRDILKGGGYGLSDARRSIELVHALRTSPETASPSLPHPALHHPRKDMPDQGSWFPPPSSNAKP